MNIVLTGFMGTGKSVTGRWLSNELGLEFVDTDDLIEDREGKKIPEIFESKGESYFREVESSVIEDFISSGSDAVFATGGGAVLNENNFKLLTDWGVVIRLTASLDVIYSRIKGKTSRPLLCRGNVRENLERIIKDREPYYSKVAFTVDTSFKSIENVTGEILAYLKTFDGE